MTNQTKLIQLRQQLPQDQQAISRYVEHALQSIDELVEKHRQYNATMAIYGDKINGNEERVYRDTVSEIKAQLLETLERTVEDFMHVGDKNWTKNYKDGIK
ncbi:hypothetical protein [Paenibacillus hunanensis]|uniref:Uncharacterized protein n=1 Tax=Paenibacillus hunanensis TaxID=539262 RepID=A0ABU1IZY6_9BACL|nr:hypothetical protein [Paenibacillus hunanensis]MCL9661519.1 hypothetical protein [Paenibacillus hunanensis]MDR6244824.1 hypothetical protein [Paenibacillus hunanensis]WPP41645.1 hypothetical protein SK066_01390 [Paenibacillus hunanensis]GGJ04396.1 hypothetical protein GCM10008022_11760 [Paenibacillus hunanensis]